MKNLSLWALFRLFSMISVASDYDSLLQWHCPFPFLMSIMVHDSLLVLLGGSPANLGNDHDELISKKSSPLVRHDAFWVSPKQSHESLYSKWTISYRCGEM